MALGIKDEELVAKCIEFAKSLPTRMPRTQKVHLFVQTLGLETSRIDINFTPYERYGTKFYDYTRLLTAYGLINDLQAQKDQQTISDFFQFIQNLPPNLPRERKVQLFAKINSKEEVHPKFTLSILKPGTVQTKLPITRDENTAPHSETHTDSILHTALAVTVFLPLPLAGLLARLLYTNLTITNYTDPVRELHSALQNLADSVGITNPLSDHLDLVLLAQLAQALVLTTESSPNY